MDLQDWLRDAHHLPINSISSNEIFALRVFFIKDDLPIAFSFDQIGYVAKEWVVISEYTTLQHPTPSQSIKLPVVQSELSCGVIITIGMSYQYFFCSISSPTDVDMDVTRFFDPSSKDHSFEEFPAELRYGAYSEDKRKFSFSVRSKYDLYTFLWVFVAEVVLCMGLLASNKQDN